MPPRLLDTTCCRQTQSCIFRTQHLRFSTSTSSLAQIRPESPRFIDVPRAVQPKQPFPIHIKGVLPTPRSIFRRRPRPQDLDKASPEYLANVTPEPIEDKTAPSEPTHKSEFVSWKARQAEMRRRNLRESLVALDYRKKKTDRFLNTREKRRAEERERLLTAPEREDERLTSPSVLQSEQPTKYRTLPDPDREARLAQKRENIARMEALRVEDRRTKLHNLYVNAGDFITTGRQLDSAIDRAFDNHEQFTNDSKPGLNVWNLGYPETVSELLGRANKDSKSQSAMDAAEGNASITRERMKRISEELTGGKMDDAR